MLTEHLREAVFALSRPARLRGRMLEAVAA
jgi:hypothetical protein